MIYIAIYFVIGLPIAVAIAIAATKDGVPIRKRILTALAVIPVWPLWSIGLCIFYVQKFKIEKICAWCGQPMLLGRAAAKQHVLRCEKHPYREILRVHGWDLVEDADGDWVLDEYEPEGK